MRTETAYDDEYATCVLTFAWLRVMSEHLQPAAVSALLGIEPTHSQTRGDLPNPTSTRPRKYGGWFLESKGAVQSRDSRRHLDWLLNQLQGKEEAIAKLKTDGNLVDLCIRWDSVGHGGPALTPKQMAQLGALDVELWFDIYFAGEDDAG
jgi:hypothetical protein